MLQVLGGDLAGVVEEGDDGSKFKKGDHVAALTPGFWTDTQDGNQAPDSGLTIRKQPQPQGPFPEV